MTNTTHYNMTIAEGTDVVNPLTQIFPNFNTIDDAMFSNKRAGIGTASEVTTGTVHAIVRSNPDSNVFRFTATSAWTAGDTMTLDGNSVVVHMSDGTVPATGAYIIGAEVLAMLTGNLVTLVISSNGGVTSFNTRTGNVVPEASDYSAGMVDFDNTNSTLTATDVQGALEELDANIREESVTVTADGVKTVKALLQSLYDSITPGKITTHSTIKRWTWSGGYSVYNLVYGEPSFYRFTSISINSDNGGISLGSNNRSALYLNGTEDTSTIPEAGLSIILYY